MFRKIKMKKEIKKIFNICNDISESDILKYTNIKIYKERKYKKYNEKFSDFLFLNRDYNFNNELLLHDIAFNITVKILPIEYINKSFSQVNSCFFNTYKTIENLFFDNNRFENYNKNNILDMIDTLESRFKRNGDEDYFNIESSIDIFKLLSLKFIMGVLFLRYDNYHNWYLQTSSLFELFKTKKNISFKLSNEYELIKDNKPVNESMEMILYYFTRNKKELLEFHSVDLQSKYKIDVKDEDTIVVSLIN